MYCKDGRRLGKKVECNHTPVIGPGGGQGFHDLDADEMFNDVHNVADAAFKGFESVTVAEGIGKNVMNLAAELDVSGCDQLRRSILKSNFQMWSKDDICGLDVKLHPASVFGLESVSQTSPRSFQDAKVLHLYVDASLTLDDEHDALAGFAISIVCEFPDGRYAFHGALAAELATAFPLVDRYIQHQKNSTDVEIVGAIFALLWVASTRSAAHAQLHLDNQAA
eukprot:6891588-Karenia_brevis.AAC.1